MFQTDSSEEFAVENDDIFQKINTLSDLMADSDLQDKASGKGSTSASAESELPSARTLRGGRALHARGRHTTTNGGGGGEFDRSFSSSGGSASPSAYSQQSYNSTGSNLSGR